jgi:hypothetical protein
VYARKVGDQVLTLQVSGKLWNRSLVIRDIETGSLWSHILGKCMDGDLKDATFDFIPATLTTWKDWKERYPESTVLDLPRTASSFVREIMDQKDVYAYGIKIGAATAAYSYTQLFEQSVMEDELAGSPLVIAFDTESTRTFAYYRNVDDQTISFEANLKDGLLVDKATGSLWDPWTGKSTAGDHKGKQLKPVCGLVTYIESWKQFYPDGRLVM